MQNLRPCLLCDSERDVLAIAEFLVCGFIKLHYISSCVSFAGWHLATSVEWQLLTSFRRLACLVWAPQTCTVSDLTFRILLNPLECRLQR